MTSRSPNSCTDSCEEPNKKTPEADAEGERILYELVSILEAQRALENESGASRLPTQKNINRLVSLYRMWGKSAKAASWQAKLS